MERRLPACPVLQPAGQPSKQRITDSMQAGSLRSIGQLGCAGGGAADEVHIPGRQRRFSIGQPLAGGDQLQSDR